MTEEVKPEVIKKTQELLGKFIKKPTLTEKLLKKPPFRFLHDICTSVMKETGFFEQVLGPDDKFENIKDKEGKIEFLQRVIAAVEAGSGVKLTVKPNKIVAGLEPTKTNEFLQALGKAVEKQQAEKKSSKHSKTKPPSKTGKEVKEEPPDKKKSSKSSKKVEESGLNDSSETKTKTNSESPKKKHSSKKQDVIPIKEENEKLKEEKSKIKNLTNGYEEKEETQIKTEEETKETQDINTELNGFHGDQNVTVEETSQRVGHSGKHKLRRSSIHTVSDQSKTPEVLGNNENLGKESGASGDSAVNDKMNSLNATEFPNKTTPSSSGQINYSKKDTNLVKESTIISRPRTGIRPTTARPASARPAAPRIRDRGDVVVSEEVMKPTSGKVQVIVDEGEVNDADDENLISLETPNDIVLEESTPILQQQTNSNNEQEHGHLVEQILEVQKELEDDSRLFEAGKTEIEWESGKNRESTNREIEKLRADIQNLTRTVNPLGKILDFFQEDIEIIQRELESWKEKNASYCLQIAQEKSITDQFVEPLKIHLKELQKSVDEQLEQINVVKANIIRNNEKIHKLLSGL